VAVARPGETVHDSEQGALRRHSREARDVRSDAIPKRISYGLKRRAREDADALGMPLCRPHTVERDGIRVTEAISPELFNLPQFDDLVPLRRTEQKIPIVAGNAGRRVPVGHGRPPAGNARAVKQPEGGLRERVRCSSLIDWPV
jgi:hypothetical protein